jgi:S1-C subfamily serine protease
MKRCKPQSNAVFLVLLLVEILTATNRPSNAQVLKPEDIYTRVVSSVATVGVETKSGDKAIGTAFLAIKDGIAITAWHLVKDAQRVRVRFSNNEEFESSGLVDKDEQHDIAFIPNGRSICRLKGICNWVSPWSGIHN